jgi:hypothetical protein
MPVPIVAAAGAVGQVAGTVAGLFGGTPDARNRVRFAQADALFQRAQAGDTAARAELIRLSTQYATQVAKDYTARLVAQLTPGGGTLPTTPSSPAPTGQVAQNGPPGSLFGGQQGMLLIGGVVVIVLAIVLFGRR